MYKKAKNIPKKKVPKSTKKKLLLRKHQSVRKAKMFLIRKKVPKIRKST